MTDVLTSRWTGEMHQVAELERDAAWHAGYAAGYTAAQEEIAATAERIARSPHPPYLSPSAEQVVRDLVDRVLAESRPSRPAPTVRYDDPDWPAPASPGAPVPFWGGDA